MRLDWIAAKINPGWQCLQYEWSTPAAARRRAGDCESNFPLGAVCEPERSESALVSRRLIETGDPDKAEKCDPAPTHRPRFRTKALLSWYGEPILTAWNQVAVTKAFRLSLTVIVGTCSRVIWLVFRYVDVLGSVKKNVDPLPSWESTQMRPPNRSMTFLPIARPIPLPGLS